MRQQNKKIITMVELAMLVALVVVLQMLSAFVKIGGVSITLTLIPIVVGGILFGKKGGAVLGFAFGVIVLINCITALDPGGYMMWAANPVMTALLCLVKGVAAGLVSSLVYKLICGKRVNLGSGRKFVATLFAAMTAPIVNTGIFLLGAVLFFRDVLNVWAGGTDLFLYIIVGLVGINFVVEFLINIILSPAVVRIIDAVKKKI